MSSLSPLRSNPAGSPARRRLTAEPIATYNVPPWFNCEALALGFKGFARLTEITRDPTRPSGRYDSAEEAVKALHKRFQFIERAPESSSCVIIHTIVPFVKGDFHVVLEASEKALLLGEETEMHFFERAPAGPLRQWRNCEEMMQGVFPNYSTVQRLFSVPVANPSPIDVHSITAADDFGKTFDFMMIHHGRAPPDALVRNVWAAFCERHGLGFDDVLGNSFVSRWFQYAKWQVPDRPTLEASRAGNTTYGADFQVPRNFVPSAPRPYVIMKNPPKFDKGHFTTTKAESGF